MRCKELIIFMLLLIRADIFILHLQIKLLFFVFIIFWKIFLVCGHTLLFCTKLSYIKFTREYFTTRKFILLQSVISFHLHRLQNGAFLTLYNFSDLSISQARLNFGIANGRGLWGRRFLLVEWLLFRLLLLLLLLKLELLFVSCNNILFLESSFCTNTLYGDDFAFLS